MYCTASLSIVGLVLMSRHSKKHLGTGAWKKVRLRVLARDGNCCAYCGQYADQVDHVQSIASGGDIYSLDNLTACCKKCNQAKGAKDGTFFFKGKSTPPAFPTVLSPSTTSTTPTLSIVDLTQPESK
jgi:hypothetical protein